MSKIQKTISSATAAAFLVVAIAQPIVSAAESGNMIDKSQQQAEAAQQQQDPQYQQMQQQQTQQIQQVQQQQQNFQQYLSPSGVVNLSRQTVYDANSGQLITLVQNSLGQISAYNQSGQQVAVQQQWLSNISFPQNINYSPVGINGNVAGGGTVDNGSTSISQTKAAQLSAVLSAIKADGNLNAVGKIAKALLALEAIKENNQIIRQQYLAQQKAKAQAQAAEQQKIQQAAQQPKAAVQQKQSAPSPTNGKKGEQTEYASVLRDSAEETGGTTTAATISYSPTTDTPQSTELPLHLDLIGKVAGVSGDTVILQDTKGQQIDVDAPNHNLQAGDHINVSGTALSGSDGNIYIVRDPESGMDVSLNIIDQDTYNQKAAEQEQSANEFAAEHPDTDSSEPASEETSYAGPADEESGGWFDGVKAHAQHLADNWTWGKTASVVGIGVGAGLIGFSGITGFASYGAAAPASLAMFKAGTSLISAGVGTLVVQDFYQQAEQTVEERHPGTSENNIIREKGNALMEEVDSHMQQ